MKSISLLGGGMSMETPLDFAFQSDSDREGTLSRRAGNRRRINRRSRRPPLPIGWRHLATAQREVGLGESRLTFRRCNAGTPD